jgi:arsenate reductase (thioredoxin)
MTSRKTHILFLCTGNSCRSQMAEGWAKILGGDAVQVKSAGIEAHGKNPRAIAAMAEAGVDISGQESGRVTKEMLERADMVVTVCGHADEHCPVVPGRVRKLHWPLADPAKATGTEEQIMAEFRATRDEVRRRVTALHEELAIPVRELPAAPLAPLVPGAMEFHLSLRVTDLEVSTQFYTAFLAARPKDRTARYSTFIVPHLRLNLVLLVNDRAESLDTYSLYHIGLGVPDKAAVIAAYYRALDLGAVVEKPPRTTWRGTPLHELWLKDPTGYLIEVYARLNSDELASMPADREPTFLVPGTAHA